MLPKGLENVKKIIIEQIGATKRSRKYKKIIIKQKGATKRSGNVKKKKIKQKGASLKILCIDIMYFHIY